jgi:hypothetical protein
MQDHRFSTQIHGDLAYSECREVGTSETPAMELDAMERARLEAAIIKTEAALRVARSRGDGAAVDRAEARYEAAMDAYLAFETETEAPPAETVRSLRDLLSSGDPDEIAIKIEGWREVLDFIFQGKTLNLWAAFKNFCAFVRRVDPERCSRVSQKTFAWLFGETRAATSAREKRVAEDGARELGVAGFHLLGGTKTDEARRKYSVAQMGNHNRRKGKGGKKG